MLTAEEILKGIEKNLERIKNKIPAILEREQ